jgi:hypothetical protein
VDLIYRHVLIRFNLDPNSVLLRTESADIYEEVEIIAKKYNLDLRNGYEIPINSGMISLNQHARVVFKKFIDRTFPKVDFKRVESRSRKN